MFLSTMLATDLYHPHTGSAWVGVVLATVIGLAFVLVIAGFATYARRREERREAAAQEANQRV